MYTWQEYYWSKIRYKTSYQILYSLWIRKWKKKKPSENFLIIQHLCIYSTKEKEPSERCKEDYIVETEVIKDYIQMPKDSSSNILILTMLWILFSTCWWVLFRFSHVDRMSKRDSHKRRGPLSHHSFLALTPLKSQSCSKSQFTS